MRPETVNGQLFHGTAAPQSLEKILPAVKHGGESHWGSMGWENGQRSNEHAFATSDESQAWHFAKYASASNGERAFVHTVAPSARMKPGVHSYLSEYVAPSFKVTGREDIMPGRQGTFPNLNWNQFRHPDTIVDTNHPYNEHDRAPSYSANEADQDLAVSRYAKQRAPQGTQLAMPMVVGERRNDRRIAQSALRGHVVREGLAPAYDAAYRPDPWVAPKKRDDILLGG